MCSMKKIMLMCIKAHGRPTSIDEGAERRGNVAKMVDRLSKDLAAKPPDIAFRKDRPKQQARARFSYSPKHEDELALQVSDLIDVLGQEEEGWLKGRLKTGATGLFPANFVEMITSPPEGHESRGGSGELDNSTDNDNENKEEIQPKKPLKYGFGDLIGPGTHVVLRPTKGNTPGQRSSDDRKTAIDFVARTSIDKANKDVPHNNNASTKQMGNTLPKSSAREMARVEFRYEAANEDELDLKQGEIITILSKSTEDPGWWYGEVDGRKGVFPDNFVKTIPPEEVPSDKKQAVISPPAVPAKPKPLSGMRSTTPEPFKPSTVTTDSVFGVKAGTAPKSISVSSNYLASSPTPDTQHLKDIANNGIDSSKLPGVPKKPPMLPTSVPKSGGPTAKTTAPSASYTSSTSQASSMGSNRTSLSAKAASLAEVLTGRKHNPNTQTVTPLGSSDSKIDEVKEEAGGEASKLSHLTASRPKQNKRPPSTVFLSQLSKEPSPSPENFSPSSPTVVKQPQYDTAKPFKALGASTEAKSPESSSSGSTFLNQERSSPLFSPPEPSSKNSTPPIAESDATMLKALRAEFDAYKRRTDDRIAELETRLKKLESNRR